MVGLLPSCMSHRQERGDRSLGSPRPDRYAHFEAGDNAAASWNAMQYRENTQTNFESMRCTPLMRTLRFGYFKMRCEAVQGKLSAPQLMAKCTSRMKPASSGKNVTASWVDMACTPVPS